jgi:methyl-accepting chemotaxis protein
MALLKKATMTAGHTGQTTDSLPMPVDLAASVRPDAGGRRRLARNHARQQKIAERVAAAAGEVASGIAETAAAAAELRQSMEQIAAGAQQAAGTAQQSLAAVSAVAASLSQARQQTERAQQRTEVLASFLLDLTAQIETAVAGITAGADQQIAQAGVVAELERQAEAVGQIVRSVGDIAEQTNLLALNAAIEAERAGAQGRGFAVVADEIRLLADRTDAGARNIRLVVEEIQASVQKVTLIIAESAAAARQDAAKGAASADSLGRIRLDMAALAQASRSIMLAAFEAERGAREIQRGAEDIAAAAEQQAAAASEALQAVAEQTTALEQSQSAAAELALLAEDLRADDDLDAREAGSRAGRVAAAAEELSATVQEVSGSAAQIMAAIGQIEAGVQAQASATSQSAAAIAQIEAGAKAALAAAADALSQTLAMSALVARSREGIDTVISGSNAALARTRDTLSTLTGLQRGVRKIERNVNLIETIAVQTSTLSVSGAMEAARSGEAGRGFGSVSADIKTLAADASANTARIQDTIEDMQDRVAAARQDFELLAGTLAAESLRNRQLPAALSRVGDDIDAVRGANEDVRRGAGLIFTAIQEVATGAEQVSAAAEQASRSATEAASAAREQARAAEELAAAIEEIASLADTLQAEQV